MLDSLRRASQTWIMKGLLVLLVLSFGVWGISTSLVPSSGDSVITVGDVDVSPSDFRLAYERQLAQLSRQFGTRLTPEQARAFGVQSQVYSQLVAGATLDQLSGDMNLGLSKDRLAKLIAEDPAFHGVNGQFDRLTFSSVLRNAGLREQDYINNRSQVAVRSQVVEAISDGYTAPKVLTDALRQYRNETRSIEYLLLSNANIDPVKAPTDDVLTPWFESRKAQYRAPEYRKISYVKLEPADIADPASVTESDLQAEYDKRKANYSTPETRTVEQLAFASRQAADAASAKLASGTAFDALITEEGKTAGDVLLGNFSKESMPDAKLAEAAFAVPADGGVSPVVVGPFGPVILRVTNITPATVRSFDDVKEDLRQELSLSNAANDIMAIHDKFEDARITGLSMKEAADQSNLKLVQIDVDATGKDRDGEAIAGIPEARSLLEEAFKTEVGSETLPINLGREGYVWFDVDEVIPARDRTIEEARETVVADWTAEQQREALATRAADLKARVARGETMAAIATELGLVVETKSGIRRGAEDAAVSAAAISAAFGGANGLVTNAPGVGNEGQILLKVTEVDLDNPGDVLENDDRQIEAIARASGDDILDQMVAELQTGYGVSINQALADSALNQQP
ncbi:peptidylprolyl isomerase [Pararhizobium antarcticum]|uniref:Parvulin-like PPIase n=1 Tax=Pararhizobium antarcticum TaxID=1798805 RepID=A0A657LWG9_9HYPH|nr:peptidylprolyl isomerase [Pararhizobium antarcticum]OJF91087.1 peptidylprolyl isomerase [Rhizobium sp. 58]OJG00017.1 peptidylprolyl isomerase [Pararhizobium antarcticum]